MRLLRGELTVDEVDAEFERMEHAKKETGAEKALLKMHWECTACRLSGEEAYMKPMEDFGVRSAWDFTHRSLPQGAWARCSRCSRKRKGELGAELGGSNEASEQQRRVASRAVHQCSTCKCTKARTEFWEADWIHRSRGVRV